MIKTKKDVAILLGLLLIFSWLSDFPYLSARQTIVRDDEPKSWTLPFPEVGDEFGAFYHHYPIEVKRVLGIIEDASGSPYVKFKMRTDTSRTVTGTDMLGEQTIDQTDYFELFTTDAGDTTQRQEMIWFEITEVSDPAPEWVTIQYHYLFRRN
jgi:hypothetical protein